MSDGNINFGGFDIFGLSDSTANPTYGDARWLPQSSSNDDQASFAVKQDINGDEVARSAAFDNKNEVSGSYKWNDVTGLGAALPKIGDISNSYITTGVTVSSSNDDFPSIEFTGHQHDTNVHDTTAARNLYSWPADVTSQLTGAFGAYDILVASNDTSAAAVASSSVTFECDHADVNNASGEHLAGENYNGRMSCSVTYNGAPDEVDTAANWNITSNNSSRENTGFETVAYSAERGITQDT